MKEPKPGDYVLATKYHDGDPQDHWCIGWYKEKYNHFGTVRHIVVDEKGQPFRANGFRRCKIISKDRGNFIVRCKKEISLSTFSLWRFARCKMW